MKAFTTAAILAYASVALAGTLGPKDVEASGVVKCHKMGTCNRDEEDCLLYSPPGTCNFLINGLNCETDCKCNGDFTLKCSNKNLVGCSSKEVTKWCSANGSNAQNNGHWYCQCDST